MLPAKLSSLKVIFVLLLAASLIIDSSTSFAQPAVSAPALVRELEPQEFAKLPAAVKSGESPEIYAKAAAVQQLRIWGTNAQNRHVYGFAAQAVILYELSAQGELLRTYDLAQTGLVNPQRLFFAPSSDLTDAAHQVHLFVVDHATLVGQAAANSFSAPCQPTQLYFPTILQAPGTAALVDAAEHAPTGRVLEIDLAPSTLQTPLAETVILPLVQTIHTSQLSPPSPDAAGIAYLAGLGQLIFSDSEVDEIPNLYRGSNVFRITLTGVLQGTLTTLAFSREPTGIAVNPQNGHLFYTDDDADKVFELNPGADGALGTADDQVTSFSTRLFESFDPEDIVYDATTTRLYIADGVNAEVYQLTPGANGSFDGVAPAGDDQVYQFDTRALGIMDPEGIGKDDNSGNLLLTGNAPAKLYEVSPTGTLVRILDIAAAQGRTLAGVTLAPGSTDAATSSYYVVDRGMDNQNFPDENDGRIYEFAKRAGTNITPVANTPEPTNTPSATATPTAPPTATPLPPATPTIAPTPTISPTTPC